jgi:hypothetical protein
MATKKVTTKRTGKKPATKKAKSIKAVQTHYRTLNIITLLYRMYQMRSILKWFKSHWVPLRLWTR